MAAKIDSSEIFSNVSQKISQLLYVRAQDARSLINQALDELNSLNYRYPVVTNVTKAVLLINQCCSLIDPEDFDLVLKCCWLIVNLVTKQKIFVEGRTLQISVVWCLKALKGRKEDVDILVALDALLRSSENELIQEVSKNITLINFAKDCSTPECALYALQILEASTFIADLDKSPKRSEFAEKYSKELQTCFNIFLEYLLKNCDFKDKLIGVKILTVCLRGLQNIVHLKPDLLHDNLGLILGIIRSYMLLGLKNINFTQPVKLLPSTLSVPEPVANLREKKGGKMTRQRKPKTQQINNTRQNENWNEDFNSYKPASNINLQVDSSSNTPNKIKTSDSDFSDTEGGNIAKLSILTGRVRQNALILFQIVIKITEKQTMFPYWSNFIPENPLSGKQNLVSCILYETSNRGRMAALNVLLLLLSSSKHYLAQAEKGDNLSFTPFSVVIGLMLTELHKCLSLALNENSIPVLIQVLKCFAALVQATPYHKLKGGLITKVIRNVKRFIHHRDSTVQVIALIVLGCCLATEPVIAETIDAFRDRTKSTNSDVNQLTKDTKNISIDDFDYADFSSSDNEEELATSSESVTTSWLLSKCLSNLEASAVPTAVKLESLQILSVMSGNHFETLLAPHLLTIVPTLNKSLEDKHDVRLHCCQTIDFIAQSIERYLATNEHHISTCVSFWISLLDGNLKTVLTTESPSNIKASACDALGSIGNFVFEHLQRDKQILCITLLFACSRDEDFTIKGAAIRALAISVVYPSLREDSGFVVDTAEAICRSLEEGNSNVRVKLAWALGNLSDALVLNKVNGNLLDEFPDSLLFKLMQNSIKASSEGEKIRMNTVRALGNFLQIVSKRLVNEKMDFRKIVEDGFGILVKNAMTGSNMKVRWNACYALGSAMKNSDLFELELSFEEVFKSLTSLVVNFKNFKVRIHAAAALAAPSRREFYSQNYHNVWISLVKALESAQIMDDFNEYKHRDNLIEQICLTLAHLMTLLTRDDLIMLNEVFASDLIKMQMKRVWERLVPEKVTPFYDAYNHINRYFGGDKNATLNSEQKASLRYLIEILKQDSY